MNQKGMNFHSFVYKLIIDRLGVLTSPLALFLFFNFTNIYPQISGGGLPFPISEKKSQMFRSMKIDEEIPFFVMPEFVIDKDEDDNVFAHKFFTKILIKDSAVKITIDGTDIYRIGIRSSGAYSLNILFTKFSVPKGAELFIYSPNQNQIIGSFTVNNNAKSGLLPTSPIFSDEVIVEYREPINAEFGGIVEIGEINHDYKNIELLRALPGFDISQSCNINVGCKSINEEQKRSACLIIVNGNMFCSGNLVNNTSQDGIPYFLTAAHCLFDNNDNLDESRASSAERRVGTAGRL